jgi:hypothetical protein
LTAKHGSQYIEDPRFSASSTTYIFAVVRLPGSREAHAAMSSVGMMVSLLEAILIIMREDGHVAQAAHPDIYIAAKKSDKN